VIIGAIIMVAYKPLYVVQAGTLDCGFGAEGFTVSPCKILLNTKSSGKIPITITNKGIKEYQITLDSGIIRLDKTIFVVNEKGEFNIIIDKNIDYTDLEEIRVSVVQVVDGNVNLSLAIRVIIK